MSGCGGPPQPLHPPQRVGLQRALGLRRSAAGLSERAAKMVSMETLTIREAADACGMTYEAMRARVDRGTLRAGKRREDGARMIPKSELQQAGLLPGADVAQLHNEVDRLRRELKEHRLLTERAQSETAAERQARELIEQSMHRERAEKQTLQAQLEQIEQAHVEASSKLEGLTDAGFFARRRILRELRRSAA